MRPPKPSDMPMKVTRRDNLEADENSLRLFNTTVTKNPGEVSVDTQNAKRVVLDIWTMIYHTLLRPNGSDARHVHMSSETAFTLFKGGVITADNFRYPSPPGGGYVQCRGLYVRAVIVIHGRSLLCDIYDEPRLGVKILDSSISSNGLSIP